MTTFISVSPGTSNLFFDRVNIQNRVLASLSIHHPARDYILSYQNYKSNNNPQAKKWDGIIRHYRRVKGTMSISVATGHLPIVLSVLKSLNEKVEIDNPYLWNSSKPTLDELKLKGITLREDQIEAVEKCVKLGRGILQAETGAGKTEIMLAIIKWFCSRSQDDVLVLTNRKAIKEGSTGLEGRFKERLDLGRQVDIRSGIYLIEHQNSTVAIAMVQSLANLLTSDDPYAKTFSNWMGNVGLVFCDEIHQRELSKRKGSHRLQEKETNIKVDFFKYVKTYHRFGMSATPFDHNGFSEDRMHQLDVMKNFGEVIPVDYKLLVAVKVHIDTVKYKRKTIHYSKVSEQTDNNLDRIRHLEDTLRWLKSEGRYPLIFVKYIKQGKVLQQILEQRGYNTVFLQGKNTKKQRENGIKMLLNREICALIVDEIFYYGINIPRIDAIIFWFIGKSYINVIQSIGRGTRAVEGKEDLLVFDYMDMDKSYLQKHSEIRLGYYKQKGYEVKL